MSGEHPAYTPLGYRALYLPCKLCLACGCEQALAAALHENKTLKLLNIESNYVSGQAIINIVAAINVHHVMTELKVSNQVRRSLQCLLLEYLNYVDLYCTVNVVLSTVLPPLVVCQSVVLIYNGHINRIIWEVIRICTL